MTFLDFEIDEKDLAAAKFIGETRRGLAVALLEAKKDNPAICQAEIARRIGMDKGVLSKALNGQSNMTLRTISEIAWALGILPVVHYCPYAKDEGEGHNHVRNTVSGAHSATVATVPWSDQAPKSNRVKVQAPIKNFRLQYAS